MRVFRFDGRAVTRDDQVRPIPVYYVAMLHHYDVLERNFVFVEVRYVVFRRGDEPHGDHNEGDEGEQGREHRHREQPGDVVIYIPTDGGHYGGDARGKRERG